uniref:Uncharacterized protein n=1 Tax=Grammatophora oceanica TaxID=210454 RepID=A0A6U5IWZ4_9STRA
MHFCCILSKRANPVTLGGIQAQAQRMLILFLQLLQVGRHDDIIYFIAVPSSSSSSSSPPPPPSLHMVAFRSHQPRNYIPSRCSLSPSLQTLAFSSPSIFALQSSRCS